MSSRGSKSGAQTPTSIRDSPVPSEIQKPSKIMTIDVNFLDGTSNAVQIQSKALGKTLFENVCKLLNLLEVDYFGLEYMDDKGTKYWLDNQKMLYRQMGLSTKPPLSFCVKFYPPDPTQLEEEYTRYLFCLQIKRDLAQGLLQCNDNTAALMASYIVQAECGDYVPEDYPDQSYLSSYKAVPYQDAELQRKIMENHKKHVGQTPAEADLNLLETARRCELYGIKITPAKDHEGVPLNLAVAHMGVLVFQNFTKINTFSWAKIRKLSFKRKRFLIKLHPEGYGYYKDTVEFYFEGRNECKNFWKKCIENHTFFRCTDVKKGSRLKPKLFSRGSSFRYSGRTQKQIVEYVRENYVKRTPFQRSTSLRASASSQRGSGTIGTSKSAQPLLPVSNSQSCGSVMMPADSNDSPPPKKVSTSEPSTPHMVQNIEQPLPNGNAVTRTEEIMNKDDITPGLESPDFDHDQEGLCSPDFLGQDTDDNISHDSYHLEDPDASKDNTVDKNEKSSELASQEYLQEKEIKKDTKESDIEAAKPNSIQSEDISTHIQSDSEQSTHSPLDVSSDSSSVSITPPHNGDSLIATLNPKGDVGYRNKKLPSEVTYFIAKELLLTERTYRKDIEIVNVWFRDVSWKRNYMSSDELDKVFSVLDSLYDLHCPLLRELEQRLASWEGRPRSPTKNLRKGIGDIMTSKTSIIERYSQYLAFLPEMIGKLVNHFNDNPQFALGYQNFEQQKICYLPLTSFLLRPAYRLLHYCFLLKKLLVHYDKDNADYADCKDALQNFQEKSSEFSKAGSSLANYIKLFEVQRDLKDSKNLLKHDREFIREGYLQKVSKKGNLPRMVFLFSDILLYTSRTSSPNLQFKVLARQQLKDIVVQEAESKQGANHCFTLTWGSKTILLSASSAEEKTKWLTDLREAISSSKDFSNNNNIYSSQEIMNEVNLDDSLENAEEDKSESTESDTEKHYRVNTTVHVCWHRNISIGRDNLKMAAQNYLSGYLFCKFKKNSSWQKLWVVFSNFCLFFYKCFQDDSPLASLPLLGYKVDTPDLQDNISREYVVKLQYKTHVYFLCAESEYTFIRWLEVITSATFLGGDKEFILV